jgi:hypothetical protein
MEAASSNLVASAKSVSRSVVFCGAVTVGPLQLAVIAQVIPCQGCYFQRFEILKAHGVKGRRPLENQGILSISSAKMHKKLSWIKVENEVQFA